MKYEWEYRDPTPVRAGCSDPSVEHHRWFIHLEVYVLHVYPKPDGTFAARFPESSNVFYTLEEAQEFTLRSYVGEIDEAILMWQEREEGREVLEHIQMLQDLRGHCEAAIQQMYESK